MNDDVGMHHAKNSEKTRSSLSNTITDTSTIMRNPSLHNSDKGHFWLAGATRPWHKLLSNFWGKWVWARAIKKYRQLGWEIWVILGQIWSSVCGRPAIYQRSKRARSPRTPETYRVETGVAEHFTLVYCSWLTNYRLRIILSVK